MASIFISYARDDATFAARLREGIEARGFSAWMDTVSIVAGEPWTEEIESAIKAAAVMLVSSRLPPTKASGYAVKCSTLSSSARGS